jgi:cold shock CspA family protein
MGDVMASGKVLWFNKVKGYGAISSGDGERLYVDEPGLKPDVDKQELRNGVEVEFEIRDGANGQREAHGVGIAAVPVAARRARMRRRGP